MDWIPSRVWWAVGFLIVREILAFVFGWGGDSWTIGSDPEGGTFGKMFNWHKREVRGTYIGWRPTDAQGGDMLTPDPGNFRRGKNGEECDTASGKPEYYHVIREAKK